MEISEIIRRAGGVSKVAKATHRHHTSVMGWKRVPVEHARTVQELTDIPLHVLRPDVWAEMADSPTPASAAQ